MKAGKPVLHHVTIVIPRGMTETVVSWYSNVLGFQKIEKLASGKSGAWLTIDGFTQLHLSEREQPNHPDSHFALIVSDLDAVLAKVMACGSSWTAQEDLFGGRRGFTRDPADNRVELLEATGAFASANRQ